MAITPEYIFTVLALCVCVFLTGYRHGRGYHRHHDPCLHKQGLVKEHTWKPAEPALWNGRYGKALEWHLGGVAWYRATKPDPKHTCRPQTCGITETLQHCDRCACGAMRFGVWGAWERRNSRA